MQILTRINETCFGKNPNKVWTNFSSVRKNRKHSYLVILVTLFTLTSLAPIAAWDVESELDDFGSQSVFARTYFIPGVGNTDNYDKAYEYDEYYSLYIRCMDQKLEVYMNTPSTVDDSDSALVRFGSGSAKSWPVVSASDNEAIFFGKASTLVSSMLKVRKFYVRASGSDGYLTANFNTTGLISYRNTFKKSGCKI